MGFSELFAFLLCLFCTLPRPLLGTGSLYDPPSRPVMWKYGFSTEKNYNYMQLNCGGERQPEDGPKQCGVCGDPVNGTREHELRGTYGTALIGRYYPAGIKEFQVKVELLAYEEGFFEFRMCPANYKPVTQTCLDEYLLPIKEGYYAGTPFRFYPKTAGDYRLTIAVPPGMTCERCVLQWRYHTGNSWGVDVKTRREGKGFGPQEEFYNCADIRIGGEIPDSVLANPFFAPPDSRPKAGTKSTIKVASAAVAVDPVKPTVVDHLNPTELSSKQDAVTNNLPGNNDTSTAWMNAIRLEAGRFEGAIKGTGSSGIIPPLDGLPSLAETTGTTGQQSSIMSGKAEVVGLVDIGEVGTIPALSETVGAFDLQSRGSGIDGTSIGVGVPPLSESVGVTDLKTSSLSGTPGAIGSKVVKSVGAIPALSENTGTVNVHLSGGLGTAGTQSSSAAGSFGDSGYQGIAVLDVGPATSENTGTTNLQSNILPGGTGDSGHQGISTVDVIPALPKSTGGSSMQSSSMAGSTGDSVHQGIATLEVGHTLFENTGTTSIQSSSITSAADGSGYQDTPTVDVPALVGREIDPQSGKTGDISSQGITTVDVIPALSANTGATDMQSRSIAGATGDSGYQGIALLDVGPTMPENTDGTSMKSSGKSGGMGISGHQSIATLDVPVLSETGAAIELQSGFTGDVGHQDIATIGIIPALSENTGATGTQSSSIAGAPGDSGYQGIALLDVGPALPENTDGTSLKSSGKSDGIGISGHQDIARLDVPILSETGGTVDAQSGLTGDVGHQGIATLTVPVLSETGAAIDIQSGFTGDVGHQDIATIGIIPALSENTGATGTQSSSIAGASGDSGYQGIALLDVGPALPENTDGTSLKSSGKSEGIGISGHQDIARLDVPILSETGGTVDPQAGLTGDVGHQGIATLDVTPAMSENTGAIGTHSSSIAGAVGDSGYQGIAILDVGPSETGGAGDIHSRSTSGKTSNIESQGIAHGDGAFVVSGTDGFTNLQSGLKGTGLSGQTDIIFGSVKSADSSLQAVIQDPIIQTGTEKIATLVVDLPNSISTNSADKSVINDLSHHVTSGQFGAIDITNTFGTGIETGMGASSFGATNDISGNTILISDTTSTKEFAPVGSEQILHSTPSGGHFDGRRSSAEASNILVAVPYESQNIQQGQNVNIEYPVDNTVSSSTGNQKDHTLNDASSIDQGIATVGLDTGNQVFENNVQLIPDLNAIGDTSSSSVINPLSGGPSSVSFESSATEISKGLTAIELNNQITKFNLQTESIPNANTAMVDTMFDSKTGTLSSEQKTATSIGGNVNTLAVGKDSTAVDMNQQISLQVEPIPDLKATVDTSIGGYVGTSISGDAVTLSKQHSGTPNDKSGVILGVGQDTTAVDISIENQMGHNNLQVAPIPDLNVAVDTSFSDKTAILSEQATVGAFDSQGNTPVDGQDLSTVDIGNQMNPSTLQVEPLPDLKPVIDTSVNSISGTLVERASSTYFGGQGSLSGVSQDLSAVDVKVGNKKKPVIDTSVTSVSAQSFEQPSGIGFGSQESTSGVGQGFSAVDGNIDNQIKPVNLQVDPLPDLIPAIDTSINSISAKSMEQPPDTGFGSQRSMSVAGQDLSLVNINIDNQKNPLNLHVDQLPDVISTNDISINSITATKIEQPSVAGLDSKGMTLDVGLDSSAVDINIDKQIYPINIPVEPLPELMPATDTSNVVSATSVELPSITDFGSKGSSPEAVQDLSTVNVNIGNQKNLINLKVDPLSDPIPATGTSISSISATLLEKPSGREVNNQGISLGFGQDLSTNNVNMGDQNYPVDLQVEPLPEIIPATDMAISSITATLSGKQSGTGFDNQGLPSGVRQDVPIGNQIIDPLPDLIPAIDTPISPISAKPLIQPSGTGIGSQLSKSEIGPDLSSVDINTGIEKIPINLHVEPIPNLNPVVDTSINSITKASLELPPGIGFDAQGKTIGIGQDLSAGDINIGKQTNPINIPVNPVHDIIPALDTSFNSKSAKSLEQPSAASFDSHVSKPAVGKDLTAVDIKVGNQINPIKLPLDPSSDVYPAIATSIHSISAKPLEQPPAASFDSHGSKPAVGQDIVAVDINVGNQMNTLNIPVEPLPDLIPVVPSGASFESHGSNSALGQDLSAVNIPVDPLPDLISSIETSINAVSAKSLELPSGLGIGSKGIPSGIGQDLSADNVHIGIEKSPINLQVEPIPALNTAVDSSFKGDIAIPSKQPSSLSSVNLGSTVELSKGMTTADKSFGTQTDQTNVQVEPIPDIYPPVDTSIKSNAVTLVKQPKDTAFENPVGSSIVGKDITAIKTDINIDNRMNQNNLQVEPIPNINMAVETSFSSNAGSFSEQQPSTSFDGQVGISSEVASQNYAVQNQPGTKFDLGVGNLAISSAGIPQSTIVDTITDVTGTGNTIGVTNERKGVQTSKKITVNYDGGANVGSNMGNKGVDGFIATLTSGAETAKHGVGLNKNVGSDTQSLGSLLGVNIDTKGSTHSTGVHTSVDKQATTITHVDSVSSVTGGGVDLQAAAVIPDPTLSGIGISNEIVRDTARMVSFDPFNLNNQDSQIVDTSVNNQVGQDTSLVQDLTLPVGSSVKETTNIVSNIGVDSASNVNNADTIVDATVLKPVSSHSDPSNILATDILLSDQGSMNTFTKAETAGASISNTDLNVDFRSSPVKEPIPDVVPILNIGKDSTTDQFPGTSSRTDYKQNTGINTNTIIESTLNVGPSTSVDAVNVVQDKPVTQTGIDISASGANNQQVNGGPLFNFGSDSGGTVSIIDAARKADSNLFEPIVFNDRSTATSSSNVVPTPQSGISAEQVPGSVSSSEPASNTIDYTVSTGTAGSGKDITTVTKDISATREILKFQGAGGTSRSTRDRPINIENQLDRFDLNRIPDQPSMDGNLQVNVDGVLTPGFGERVDRTSRFRNLNRSPDTTHRRPRNNDLSERGTRTSRISNGDSRTSERNRRLVRDPRTGMESRISGPAIDVLLMPRNRDRAFDRSRRPLSSRRRGRTEFIDSRRDRDFRERDRVSIRGRSRFDSPMQDDLPFTRRSTIRSTSRLSRRREDRPPRPRDIPIDRFRSPRRRRFPPDDGPIGREDFLRDLFARDRRRRRRPRPLDPLFGPEGRFGPERFETGRFRPVVGADGFFPPRPLERGIAPPFGGFPLLGGEGFRGRGFPFLDGGVLPAGSPILTPALGTVPFDPFMGGALTATGFTGF